jgi:hypothetical protein
VNNAPRPRRLDRALQHPDVESEGGPAVTSREPLPAAESLPLHPLPIEVFDPLSDVVRHSGRAAVRRTVLAMLPVNGEQLLLPGPIDSFGGPSGAFWALRSRNDLNVALRTASFSTARGARNDAVELLTRADEFESIVVQAPKGGLFSYWVALDGRVVLVAGQAWRSPEKSTARALRETLSRLPRLR